MGAKYRVCWHLRHTFLFFWISAWNGKIWRKSEKRGILDGQKQANMAIFMSRPQVSLTISQGSIIFFLLEDMSVMCLSLLTNSVGLKGKELQFFWKLVIFLIDRYYLCFTHSGKDFDHPNLLYLIQNYIIIYIYVSNKQFNLYIASSVWIAPLRRITTIINK